MADPTAAIAREATFSDRDAVESLLSSFGLGMARNPENVHRWWD